MNNKKAKQLRKETGQPHPGRKGGGQVGPNTKGGIGRTFMRGFMKGRGKR